MSAPQLPTIYHGNTQAEMRGGSSRDGVVSALINRQKLVNSIHQIPQFQPSSLAAALLRFRFPQNTHRENQLTGLQGFARTTMNDDDYDGGPTLLFIVHRRPKRRVGRYNKRLQVSSNTDKTRLNGHRMASSPSCLIFCGKVVISQTDSKGGVIVVLKSSRSSPAQNRDWGQTCMAHCGKPVLMRLLLAIKLVKTICKLRYVTFYGARKQFNRI